MNPVELDFAARISVAGLGGLLVGTEREWSGGNDATTQRFAGIRTFLMLGLSGGLAALLHEVERPGAGVALLVLTGLLVVAAFSVRALRGDVDGTTEVAAVLTLGAGFLCGLGFLQLGVAVYAVMALILAEKGRLHGLVRRIASDTLEAALRFAVLALVILPLLPAGPFGPEPGIHPRELWSLVLIFSGLAFGGSIALRLVGPERGYGVAGLLGGLVSSTAVTLGFSRLSRDRGEFGTAMAFGVLAACAVMYVRMTLVSAGLNRALAGAAAPYLAVPFGVALAALGGGWLLRRRATPSLELPRVDLGLWSAVQMAVLFQLVLYGVHAARDRFGDMGLLATAALLGLADVDALTLSMARVARDEAALDTAARALAVGAISNALLKMTLVLVLGGGRFRWIAGGGLLALAASGALALAVC